MSKMNGLSPHPLMHTGPTSQNFPRVLFFGSRFRAPRAVFRLVLENETVVRPDQLVDLLPLVHLLRRYDDASRRIGEAARARATRELSVEAAMCYWAVLLAEVGALQRRGGFAF